MSYAKFQDVFWDSEAIDSLSDRACLLATYLITGPHRNAIGCFRLGKGALTDHPRFAKWGIEGVSQALSELVGIGFCVRDDRTGWTFITKHLDHDPINGWKSAVHAVSLAAKVPASTGVYRELYQQLSAIAAAHSEALEGKQGWPLREPEKAPSKGHTKGNRSPYPLPVPSPEPLPEPEPLTVHPPNLGNSTTREIDLTIPDDLRRTKKTNGLGRGECDPVGERFEVEWKRCPNRSPSKGTKKTAEAHFRRAVKGGADPDHIAEQREAWIAAEVAAGNCRPDGKGGYTATRHMQSAETFFSTGWTREFTKPPDDVGDAIERLQAR